MAEKIMDNLEISEEKSIKNTLLFIRNVKVNMESYEAKILSEDNIDNLIKFQVSFDGENRVLLYDVTNTMSFEEYIKMKSLNKDDICNIVSAIDDMLSSVENYLISENSIMLNLKLIRVIKDLNRTSYKFIAIPNYNSEFSYELSKFLIRMLRYVNVEDKDALSLAYGLFVKSSKENYTMNDLMELVDSVKTKNVSQENIDSLTQYDEELASEISSDVIEENKADITDMVYEDTDNGNDLNDSGLIIDSDTKDALNDALFDSFDNKQKVLKFTKKPFELAKEKTLKGHIRLNFFGLVLVPFFIIIFPVFYFLFIK